MTSLNTLPLEEFGLPEIVEIEPIHSCNFRCIQCHVSYETLTKNKIRPDFFKNLKGLEGKWALLGSLYEPTVHPHFREIAQGLSDAGMKLEMTTNGSLFNESLVKDVAHCNWKNVIFSFDGITKETFEKIRRRADFKKTLEGIKRFKDGIENKDTFFAVNFTLLRSNLHEIVDSVDFWEDFGVDHLGFIAMVLRDENKELQEECLNHDLVELKTELELAARRVVEKQYKITLSSAAYSSWMDLKDIYPAHFMESLVKSNNRNARTPFNARTYYQNGHFPGMSVNCRSPFKFARIDYNGNVELCYQFTVGNIYKNEFLDIWYGKEAQKVRDLVRSDPKVCYSCDYFRFCIKAGEVDYDKEANFRNETIDNYYNKPFLVKDKGSYQLVGYGSMIYGFPKSMGDVDPRFLAEYENKPGVFVCATTEEVKQKIDEYFASIDKSEWIPIEIDNWIAHKVVSYGPQLVAIPKGYGKIVLNAEFDFNAPGIFIADDVETLRNAVDTYIKTVNISELMPTVIEQISGYNIVEWQNNFYGIPFTSGQVDLVGATSDEISKIPGVIKSASLNMIKDELRKLDFEPEFIELCLHLGYNAIYFEGVFYAIPHSIGKVDLSNPAERKHPEIISSSDKNKFRREIISKTYAYPLLRRFLGDFGYRTLKGWKIKLLGSGKL